MYVCIQILFNNNNSTKIGQNWRVYRDQGANDLDVQAVIRIVWIVFVRFVLLNVLLLIILIQLHCNRIMQKLHNRETLHTELDIGEMIFY